MEPISICQGSLCSKGAWPRAAVPDLRGVALRWWSKLKLRDTSSIFEKNTVTRSRRHEDCWPEVVHRFAVRSSSVTSCLPAAGFGQLLWEKASGAWKAVQEMTVVASLWILPFKGLSPAQEAHSPLVSNYGLFKNEIQILFSLQFICIFFKWLLTY